VNRYLVLLLAAMVLGALVSVLARAPRRGTEPGPARAAPPAALLELEVRDDAIVSSASAVPKDHRVAIRIVNRGGTPARISLAGYEDRLAVALGPGESWRGEFLADRPGADFAWLLDGKPVARLAVTGSHLVDGHR